MSESSQRKLVFRVGASLLAAGSLLGACEKSQKAEEPMIYVNPGPMDMSAEPPAEEMALERAPEEIRVNTQPDYEPPQELNPTPGDASKDMGADGTAEAPEQPEPVKPIRVNTRPRPEPPKPPIRVNTRPDYELKKTSPSGEE